jgi:S1/P1 Nuclease
MAPPRRSSSLRRSALKATIDRQSLAHPDRRKAEWRNQSEAALKKIIILLVLVSFVGTQLGAWGPKGHQIVGDIATSRLTPATRENIQLLLGSESLASVSTWADEVRPNRPESFGWHFVDIPRDAPGFSQERDCFRPDEKHPYTQTDHHNCVVDRIEIFKKVLADENASRAERVEALKWIVHFVGDLHQPLHAIEEGRGGNDFKVVEFGSAQCGNYPCNLHWNWDAGLLEHTGYPEAEYVERLNKLIEQQHLAAQATGTAVDWANESHLEARQVIDPVPTVVDEQYFQSHIGLINRKLALAGLRLAALLNQTLGSIPTAKLKQDLEKHSQGM